MPYNETVIEDIPLGWIEFYTGWGFPNHSNFKPVLPKWWQGEIVPCRDDECGHSYLLDDVDVIDPFVDVTAFRGSEYHVFHHCPKCGRMSSTRKRLFDILKDQIDSHIQAESSKARAMAASTTATAHPA